MRYFLRVGILIYTSCGNHAIAIFDVESRANFVEYSWQVIMVIMKGYGVWRFISFVVRFTFAKLLSLFDAIVLRNISRSSLRTSILYTMLLDGTRLSFGMKTCFVSRFA